MGLGIIACTYVCITIFDVIIFNVFPCCFDLLFQRHGFIGKEAISTCRMRNGGGYCRRMQRYRPLLAVYKNITNYIHT